MASWVLSTKTNDPYIDGVLGGTRWTLPVVTYGFGSTVTDYVARLEDYAYQVTKDGTTTTVNELKSVAVLPTDLIRAANAAMAAFEALTLQDVERLDSGLSAATVRLALTDAADKSPHYADNPAYANPPNGTRPGDIWVQAGRYPTAPLGTEGYILAFHEIGHALGLKHPHDTGGTVLPVDRDSLDFTVMSYRTFVGSAIEDGGVLQGSFPQGFMMYDIAALQHLYGADFGFNGGGTTYRFDPLTGEMFVDEVGQGKAQTIFTNGSTGDANILFRTIWDGGGTDLYDFSAFATNLAVDLRPGQWSDLDVGGTTLRAVLRFDTTDPAKMRFALGHVYNALQYQGSGLSLIENARAGSGNDRMLGNWGNNRLWGEGGDDTLAGLEGIDTLEGGAGFDIADYGATQFSITALLGPGGDGYAIADGGQEPLRGIEGVLGGAWADRIEGNAEANFLGGGGSGDTLRGRDGDDTLTGDGGDDLLDGGDGSDRLDGGEGRDTADYTGSPFRVLASLEGGKATGGWGTGDTFVSIENLNGSGYDDSLGGDGTDNVISGYGGADAIEGHDGDDTLYGDGGADTLQGGPGNDLLHGGEGHDFARYEGNGLWLTADSGDGTDTLIAVEGIAGTVGADTMIGNAAGNHLFGGDGDDALYGFAEADTLQGGAGWDFLDGGPGADMVSYRDRPEGRKIDLGFDRGDGTFGKVSGDDSGDTFVSIEDAEGTLFDDTLIGDAGFNILRGLDGNDEVHGGGGDAIWGGLGDDILLTGGSDYAYGEDGRDTVLFTGAAVGVNLANQSLNGGAATFGRFFGVEVFRGTGGNDTFAAGDFGVAFLGLGGQDVLTGSAFDDTLGGGAGADLLNGGDGFDIADYTADTEGVLVDLRAYVFAYGEAQGDLLYGIEAVEGGIGNDSLGGTEGANRLWGGDGDDYMAGYGDVDAMWGGRGNDRIEAGYGADYVDGGAGDDLLGDNEQIVLLFATDDDAADTLLGGEGADTLLAAGGADLLGGGGGDDSLDGGAGANIALFGGMAADFLVSLLDAGRLRVADQREGAPEGADTLAGIAFLQFLDRIIGAPGGWTDGADTLLGGAGPTLILAAGGNDLLRGQRAADTLDGGAGADTLMGAGGDDLLVVDEAGDRIIELARGGTDTVRATLSWTLGAHLENLVLAGVGAINGTGNGLANVIEGNAAANLLIGGGRADTLIGGDGNDTYAADATDLLVEEPGGGLDTAVMNASFTLPAHVEVLRFNGTANARGDGNGADNLMVGNAGSNRLLGEDGNDTLNGGAGDDILFGGAGADSLVGGEGADRLIGGPGDDSYVLSDPDQVVELPEEGLDTILTTIGMALPAHVENLVLLGSGDLAGTGNGLDNTITGNAGANLLRGLGGNDRLQGGQGHDTLEGGAGADTLSGSGGFDHFLWRSLAEGPDVVTDFRVGDDRLAFAAAALGGVLPVGSLAAARFANDAPSLASGQFVYVKAGGALAWDPDGTGATDAVLVATLTNQPNLSAGDFLIVA